MGSHCAKMSAQLGKTSCGLRQEQNSSYGDRSVSSTDFDVRVAVITRLYFSHALTEQCISNDRQAIAKPVDIKHRTTYPPVNQQLEEITQIAPNKGRISDGQLTASKIPQSWKTQKPWDMFSQPNGNPIALVG